MSVQRSKMLREQQVPKDNEGYYYFIQFDAEPTVPAAVEQDVRIMDNVLRFLCVRKDEK